MIKIEFDSDKDNDFKNCTMKYSHKKTNAIEILMLINNLIDLIEQNDEGISDEQIFNTLYSLRVEKNKIKESDKNDKE